MIYLDYQATTPLAPEVFDAMVPWLRDQFANPHSPHKLGRAAHAAVEVAREQILAALALPAGRLAFTSGATEALNIAIEGAAALARATDPKRVRLLAPDTEHSAVRDTILSLGERGFHAELLPVGSDGLVSLDAVRAAMGDDVALVAAMLVNNEIGVIQPVAELCEIAHASGALFLCDAVQGFGRADLPHAADMIAVTAHKIHGPKGIGGLWVRDGLELPAMTHGGGQEYGLRPGTLSPALCAGFGVAAKLAADRRGEDRQHVEMLWNRARELFPDWAINGSTEQRYHGNFNIRRHGVDGARLLSECREVAFSLGSACASGSAKPSRVLQALGLSAKEAKSSVRIGFGRYTSLDDLERAADLLNSAARAM